MMLDSTSQPFIAPFAPDDRAIARALLKDAHLTAEQDRRIDRTATRLIEAIRANDDRLGGVEDMLREFALTTKEGLALMVLAEALLRVPDARTADQFIEDKLGEGDFVHHETKSSAFLVNASAWALGMSARVIQPGETPEGTIGRLAKRLGVDETEREVVYYSALVAWVGCHVDAYEQAKWFGDDTALKTDFRRTDFATAASRPLFMLRHLGAGRPITERTRLGMAFLGEGRKAAEAMLDNHWTAADELAARLGMAQRVRDSAHPTSAVAPTATRMPACTRPLPRIGRCWLAGSALEVTDQQGTKWLICLDYPSGGSISRPRACCC